MAGIALFAPDRQVYCTAEELLKKGGHHIRNFQLTEGGANAVLEARKAVSEGVNIIIGRGRQAALIRRYTNISVVDIQLTAQEVGLLIQRIRKKIGRTDPKIGLMGHSTMFCDISHLGELLNVDVKLYPLDEEDCFQQMVDQAMDDGVDGIISGINVLEYLKGREIVVEYFGSTEESVKNAIAQAEALYQISEKEHKYYVHFTSVLESATNGLLQMNSRGEVTAVNPTMERILKKSMEDVVGKPVTQVLERLEQKAVTQVLESPKESYTGFLQVGNDNLVILITPVVVADRIDGAILSCNKVKHSYNDREAKQMQEQYLRGYVAKNTFESLKSMTTGIFETIETAQRYALSSSPVLIQGNPGDEREELAQAIHNHSMRRSGPYISVNMVGLTDEAQIELLFGKRFLNADSRDRSQGAVGAAKNGTLVIHALDKMGIRTQYFINHIIQNNSLIYNDIQRVQSVNIRIIGICTKPLKPLVETNQFRDDLYYMFHSMTLVLPPLRSRKKDLEVLIDAFIQKYIEKYSKFHLFTDNAKRVMLNYKWEGNQIQLDRFCERLVLSAGKRMITDQLVWNLLEELYGQEQDEFPKSPEQGEDSWEALIRRTLKKNHGNKAKTARELQISTTTLWRKMKKYHIDEGI